MRIGKIWAVLLLAAVLSGCSKSMNAPETTTGKGSSQFYGYDENTLVPNEALTAESYKYDDISGGAAADYGGEAGAQSAAGVDVAETERKIIKTAWLSIETYDYDGSAKKLQDTVLIYGGYVQKADISAYNGRDNESLKRGTYVLRVPQEYFETAKDEIEKTGKVLSSSIGGDDVTSQYYDIESRLNIKKEEEKRIIAMIAKAEKIEDLIKLEEKLSEIRTDIEIYQTRLNSIDRLSSFSTITVDLTEISEKDKITYDEDFGGKLKAGFIASVNFVISFFQGIILVIAYALVPVLLLGIIGFIVWMFVRKRGKKDKKE